jgi:uncharacterized protein (TIGR04141 family)
MAKENVVSIYKIDSRAVYFSDCNDNFEKIIEKIITRGNSNNRLKNGKNEKEISNYTEKEINEINRYDFNVRLFHAFRVRPSSWEGFLRSVLKNNQDSFFSRDHDFIVFVYDNDDLFCFTGGVASNLINDVCDEDFPKQIMLRLSDPGKIKEARSRGLTGAFYARDFYFRGDYSISPTESFGSVWKDICVLLKESVKEDEDWKLIVGESKKRKVSCEVKSSFKIKKRVSFETAIKLIRKIQQERQRDLTEDEKNGFYFLNTISIVKNKEIKEELYKTIINSAFQFLINNPDFKNFDYDFCHKEYVNFLDANSYRISSGRKEICVIDEINNAEEVLSKIKDEVSLIDLESFSKDLESIKISSQHENEINDTNGNFLDHLNGEVTFDGKVYFLIDKEWCLVQDKFLESLDGDFKSFVKNHIIDSINLNSWSSGGEGAFNESHLTKDNYLVADRIMLEGIEIFDIACYDDDNLFLIQVKDGLGASTRDACSQLRNSAKIISESTKSVDHQKIKDFYQKLKTTNTAYTQGDDFKKQLNIFDSEEKFIDLFISKNITYVLAFRYGNDESDILSVNSNIAKFEIVSLRDYIKTLDKSLFKIYQIKF